jgi:hypothetical protein
MKMDKQHAVAGVGGVIRVGQTEYRLRPLTLGDLAEIKAFVVLRRMSPLEALGRELERVDSKHHAELMRVALREACNQRGATAEEIDAYLQTFDGTAHLFWLMARDDCAALDAVEAAKSCLAEFANGRLLELQGQLDQATGFLSDTASLGNSSGQARSTAMEAASNGPASIAS